MLTREQIEAMDLKQANLYLRELDLLYNLERPLSQQPADIMAQVDLVSTQVAYLDEHIRQLNFLRNQ